MTVAVEAPVEISAAHLRRLWSAVLLEVWAVANTAHRAHKVPPSEVDASRRWFGSRDFYTVCAMADVCPRRVMQCYAAAEPQRVAADLARVQLARRQQAGAYAARLQRNRASAAQFARDLDLITAEVSRLTGIPVATLRCADNHKHVVFAKAMLACMALRRGVTMRAIASWAVMCRTSVSKAPERWEAALAYFAAQDPLWPADLPVGEIQDVEVAA